MINERASTRPRAGDDRSSWRESAFAIARRFKPRNRIQAALLVIAALTWLIAGIAAFDQYTRVGPMTDRHRDVLAAELKTVPAPPGVAAGSLVSESKPGQALVTVTFKGSLGLPLLRQYYDDVLARSGWSFTRELDLGGYRLACYQRSDERASITENPGGRSYSLAFSFGLHTCD